ncbi:MAG: hypothetical protein NWE95_08425 [Candidatus Bathyarchaeota archaeon]|nr:hypothetical protein [Candidatus Bathyarchaeota archaeon]
MLIVILLTMTQHLPITNAQITSSFGRGYYGANSPVNYCSFNLTMNSPNNQTVYSKIMPLNFSIKWMQYPKFLLPIPLNGYYAYSIDNGPFVRLLPTPSASDSIVGSKDNFLINPSFAYTVDISHLKPGYHDIVINASLYHHNNFPPEHFYFNITTYPYVFSVEEQTIPLTSSPTPFSPMDPIPVGVIIIAVTFIVFTIITIALFLRRQQQKLVRKSPTCGLTN